MDFCIGNSLIVSSFTTVTLFISTMETTATASKYDTGLRGFAIQREDAEGHRMSRYLAAFASPQVAGMTEVGTSSATDQSEARKPSPSYTSSWPSPGRGTTSPAVHLSAATASLTRAWPAFPPFHGWPVLV